MPDNPVRLLVVEDNPGDVDLVREMLDAAAPGRFRIAHATRLAQGIELLAGGEVDVALTDLGLPDSSDLDTFRALHAAAPDLPVVVLTGSNDIEMGLKAVRSGAQDYLIKGAIDAELLARVLRYAIERKRAELALRASEERYRGLVEVALAAAAEHQIDGLVYRGMVSRHPLALQALAIVRKVAAARIPVLIRGESGVGKELIARALHDSSPRCAGPFVVINCAAVPETLLEAELFGIEKGTATGVAGRAGRLESADGGTVFLDEIGDMDPVLQAKLLRFLQDGVVEHVGGGRPVNVEVRVVAATNQNLEELMQQGKFRKDLYYRLNAVELTLPPLRGRTGDIRDFIHYFIERCNVENERGIKAVSEAAFSRMVAYEWPGNIRQLQHVITRAVLIADGDTIELKDLPADLQRVVPRGSEVHAGPVREATKAAQDQVSSEVERKLVLDCLERSSWHVGRAAEMAGYSRAHLHRLMQKHGIRRPTRTKSDG